MSNKTDSPIADLSEPDTFDSESDIIEESDAISDTDVPMTKAKTNINNNNSNDDHIFAIFQQQLEQAARDKESLRKEKKQQFEQAAKDKEILLKQIEDLQTQIKHLNDNITKLTNRLDNKNNDQQQQQSNRQQRSNSGSRQRNRSAEGPRNDVSAVNNPSYLEIAKKRKIFNNIPEVPVTARHKGMASANKAVSGECKSVAEILQACKPATRPKSADTCRPVYIKLHLSRYAQQGKFRIVKEISEKAVGKHPYNIRSVFGGIYELAYDKTDVIEAKTRLRDSGVDVLDDIDIFTPPPTQLDKPMAQTADQITKSMGFALGRAYHPAVADLGLGLASV